MYLLQYDKKVKSFLSWQTIPTVKYLSLNQLWIFNAFAMKPMLTFLTLNICEVWINWRLTVTLFGPL